MTWDGIPEHRNRDDGEQPGNPWLGSLRDFLGGPQKPPVPALPADPFNGLDAPAVATVEMFRAYHDAGMTEQQSLFFCACLIQVGLAIQQGGLIPPAET